MLKLIRIAVRGLALAVASWACLNAAFAETNVVRVGLGVGTTYLPLQVMIDQHLLEKHAAALGVSGVKMEQFQFGSANAMNDALLSGSIDYGSGGVSTFLPLWAKTKTSVQVKGVGALSAMPMYLVTRDPNVKTVKDFTAKDKIAVAGIKVSFQALILQMAAAQAFGEDNWAQLDKLTVPRSNSDGVIALTSGTEITAHLSPPPFSTKELQDKNMHVVLNSYDVLGGPGTLTMVWGTEKFAKQNPKIARAFYLALKEAQDIINSNLHAAADTYLRVSKDKVNSAQAIYDVISRSDVKWTIVPTGTLRVAKFMHKVGTIESEPAKWSDMFFPELGNASGS